MGAPTGTGWLQPLAVAGLLAVAVLAGCTDEADKPGTLPSPSATTTSSTPSPTPTPVEQQVEAAVRAYYAELTRAAQTNETTVLRRMLDENCPCFNAVRILERNNREGQSTPDARFILSSVRAHDITGRAAVAEVKYRVTGYDVLRRDGTVKTHISAQSSHADLSLVQVEARWVVANLFDLEG